MPPPVRGIRSVGIVPDGRRYGPAPTMKPVGPLADKHLCSVSRLIRNGVAPDRASRPPRAALDDERRQAMSHGGPRRHGPSRRNSAGPEGPPTPTPDFAAGLRHAAATGPRQAPEQPPHPQQSAKRAAYPDDAA